MKVNSFVVSECGNSPEEAWNRAQAIAALDNQDQPQNNYGILKKDGFDFIGRAYEGMTKEEMVFAAFNISKCHNKCNVENTKALCIDALNGEYYFIGKVALDK